jgi:hypothetical protein
VVVSGDLDTMRVNNLYQVEAWWRLGGDTVECLWGISLLSLKAWFTCTILINNLKI